MNTFQRVLNGLGLLTAALVGVFPPWIETWRDGTIKHVSAVGYSFIATPPPPTQPDASVSLDVARTILQLVSVATVFGALAHLQPAFMRLHPSLMSGLQTFRLGARKVVTDSETRGRAAVNEVRVGALPVLRRLLWILAICWAAWWTLREFLSE